MIKGVLNGEFQSNLSKDKLNEFEVLEINHEKKEIILQKDSQKFQCKILKKNNKDQSFVIKINGNISTIRIVKSVEKTIEKLGINKKSQQNINILKAPMPGLILKLMVKAGDQIKKGEALIILEAMKMENILSSPVDGIIKEIKVKPQQTVEKNNVLINFES
jgi:biotin carboxyl carrier protein